MRVVSDLVSLSDASRVLGVSAERVRQLVVAGDLPAQRFGNAWAVPRDSLIVRRDMPASGGRPLGSVRAWMEIAAGYVDLGRPTRYQRRARIVRCEMSSADVESLPKKSHALVGGVHGAMNYGASLAEDGSSDLYLARSAFDRLANEVAYNVDPLGGVRLRVVDDEAWEIIPRDRFAPVAAVALDLLESADPRHRTAARELTSEQTRQHPPGELTNVGEMGGRLREVEAHRDDILELVRRHHGRSIAVFGSVSRGDDGPESDVDFLVDFEPGSSLFDVAHLQDDLEALIGCRVDVVSSGGLKDRDQQIRAEAIPL